MTTMKRTTTLLAAVTVGLGLTAAACSSTSNTATSSTTAPSTTGMATGTTGKSTGTTMATTSGSTPGTAKAGAKDLVETAVAAGSFTTLASLLTEAGLVDTLKGPGPYTVFAPTDAAFAKVPASTLDALKKDPAKLKEVLLYHVLKGEVLAKDVKPGTVDTVAGKPLTITVDGGNVKVGDATVTKTDVMADNGVIHVIDNVLLPPS